MTVQAANIGGSAGTTALQCTGVEHLRKDGGGRIKENQPSSKHA